MSSDTVEPRLTVLVYSDDANVRSTVRAALGRRPAIDLPFVDYIECATEPMVVRHLDTGGVDLVILDGVADRASIVEIDQGKYILNMIDGEIVNKVQIEKTFQQKHKYTAVDLKLDYYNN